MLSKCANPACSEQFQYLHQGKLFHLTPTPELQSISEESCAFLYERFWLCDECSRKMTVVWDGSRAKVISLPATTSRELGVDETMPKRRRNGRRAFAARSR
jgi:hypothetical protein